MTAGPLHSCEGHQDEVLQLQWSPHDESVFGICWGRSPLKCMGFDLYWPEQDEEDALTDHQNFCSFGGHTNRIPDFCWNPNEPWVICSIEDNIAQVWQMSSSIYSEK